MRFRGMSITMIGAATLLLTLAPEADAQRRRLGVLRPAPRPSIGGRLPRLGFLSPHFFNSCFVVPQFFPFLGGVPFVNIQLFASAQPSPDPSSHLVPDPSAQPLPFPGSHPAPGGHAAPVTQPMAGGVTTNPHAAPTFGAPVYSAPVYTAPVYAGATPVATPHVSNGMVVGDVVIDPTFSLWGSQFFFGGGFVCGPTRFFGSTVIIR
jgi:hypothetical protein